MMYAKLAKRCSLFVSLLIVLGLDSGLSSAYAQNQGNSVGQGNNGGARPGRNRRARARARARGTGQNANPLGPAFVKGQDNAQNPNKLKSGMKVQERRQNHQYEQAMNQVKEQQQQEYEKEMLQTLGEQRPAIKQNRKDIGKVREATGANQ
jgi:hypothetical protein